MNALLSLMSKEWKVLKVGPDIEKRINELTEYKWEVEHVLAGYGFLRKDSEDSFISRSRVFLSRERDEARSKREKKEEEEVRIKEGAKAKASHDKLLGVELF